MIIPDSANRHQGHYLGTEIDEKWWKRYPKDKLFARGNGEYWLDGSGFFFRRYLTKRPIQIPLRDIVEIKIGRSHAGKWLLRSPVLKLIWQKDGIKLSSGFIVSQNQQGTEAFIADLSRRLPQQFTTH
jgi:hypothetical protein